MATKGKITITFNTDASDGETISFERTSTYGTISLDSTFVSGSRVANNQIPLTTPTLNVGEMTAAAYETYFNIDQNQGKLMNISRNINVIEIDILYGWDFQNFSSDVPSIGGVLVPEVPDTFQLLTASLITYITDPCEFITVNVLMSEQATGYYLQLPGTYQSVPITTVSTNPFNVDVPRLQGYQLKVIKSGSSNVINVSEYFNEPFFYFRRVGQQNIVLTVASDYFSGSTVSASVDYLNQLTERPNPLLQIQYSLDGYNWFDDGTFSGQVPGDYTLFIKDGMGCTIQKDFKIKGTVGQRTPFFFISEANSISFSQSQVWNNEQNGIYKNPNNVLATSDLQENLYKERLIFRKEDEVRIQFKSNYEYHDISVEDCEGNDTGLNPTSPEKMSNNMNLYESLDCKLVGLSNTRAGIYFDSGNYYDINGTVEGTYELFGNLPDSAVIDNKIRIPGRGVFVIQDVIYNEELNKKLIVFNMNNSIGVNFPVDEIMQCHYNLLNFEVYEFNIDFSVPIIKSGLEKLIRVNIRATDDLFDEIFFCSEYSLIVDSDDFNGNKYLGINYYGSNNRSIFYLYGIEHFIRAEIIDISSYIDDDNDILKGDLHTYLTESTVHKGIKILFSEVTYRMMMKLSLALSSEFLFVNGLGYVKDKSLKIEQIEHTNLYTMECQLISTNSNYNPMANQRTGEREGYKTLYIPNIVGTDTGVVKL